MISTTENPTTHVVHYDDLPRPKYDEIFDNLPDLEYAIDSHGNRRPKCDCSEYSEDWRRVELGYTSSVKMEWLGPRQRLPDGRLVPYKDNPYASGSEDETSDVWDHITNGWDDMSDSGEVAFLLCEGCQRVFREPDLIEWS